MTNTEINLTPTATVSEIDSSSPIPCRTWGIASESSIGIVLIHGLGAHAGWFEALARRLKVKHIFVLSYDLTGFGKQKHKRYFSYKQWLDETTAAFDYMRSIMPKKPIFLLGNSMGALIAMASCQKIKPSGIILLSPAFAGHPNVFSLPYQLLELCKAIVNPDSEIKLPYGADLIAKQELVRSWLDKDPDRRQSVPRRMLLDLFLLTLKLRWQRIRPPCPLFMLTAGLDGLVDNQINELIFQQIISPNKKKTLLSSAAHDLALDPAVNQVADLLFDWMNSN